MQPIQIKHGKKIFSCKKEIWGLKEFCVFALSQDYLEILLKGKVQRAWDGNCFRVVFVREFIKIVLRVSTYRRGNFIILRPWWLLNRVTIEKGSSKQSAVPFKLLIVVLILVPKLCIGRIFLNCSIGKSDGLRSRKISLLDI